MPENYHDELVAFCKRLKIASAMADRAETTEGETHVEFLYNLLKREIELRDQSHIDNLINEAKFPVEYSFDQFRTDEVEFPADCTIETLKSLEFLREHKNIIMYGGTGTGKTMLSICIGLLACRRKIPVRFFRTTTLVNTLSSKMRTGKLDAFRDKLSKASIYVIDEFGYVPYDKNGINILFDFLSEISDDPTKVVILNTNLEFSRWVNVLYDEQMTAALIGRLTHHCHLILFPGGNNRLRESSLNETYHEIAAKSCKED
jgi:DNA replication protein DnaC